MTRWLLRIGLALATVTVLLVLLDPRILPPSYQPARLIGALATPQETTFPLPEAYWRGMAAAEAGDWATATKEFGTALNAAPAAPPVYFAMGNALAEQGRNLLAVIHFNAYLELLPQAPNRDRVKVRIGTLLEPYREIGRDLQEQALRLSQMTPEKDYSGLYHDLTIAGANDDVDTALASLPRGATKGIVEALILLYRISLPARPEQIEILRKAVRAEAQFYARDPEGRGCPLPRNYTANEACPQPGDLIGASESYKQYARQCWRNRSGAGQHLANPVNADRMAAGLSFYAALLTRLANSGMSDVYRPMLADYERYRKAGVAYCFSAWPVPQGINVVEVTNTLEPSTATGHLNFSAPDMTVQSAPAKISYVRTARERIFEASPRGIHQLPGWYLQFSEALFADLGSAIMAIAELPPAERGPAMWRLATRLKYLDRELRAVP